VASFGVRLKQVREQRGVTLEEISATTKIGTRMLVALEQDHFDQLPGGIFNKGFIRAYARCLGLDEDQAIADYLIASGNLPPEKEKEKEKDKERDKRSDGVAESSFELQAEAESRQSTLPWGTFAILLLLVALGFAVWGFYSSEIRKRARKTLPIPPSTTLSQSPASPNPVTPSPVTAPPVSTPPVSAAPVIKPSPTSPPPAVPKPLSLRITLHSDSWLFVTSDGREILQGSFTAPTEKTIHAAKEIVVKAGDVGALDFEFNGKALPAQGAPGEVRTLTFDATGMHSATPPPETPVPQP
jgi:cytoskeleton protein RodZ